MSNLNLKAFLDVVQRSGLVETRKLKRSLLDCKEHHDGHLPSDTQTVADWLVNSGLLTRWQCDRLLERRHKGFFVGKYKLLDHLGTGGMSSVYLAEHTLLGKRRAMKVLPKHRVGDTSYLARFEREAQSAAALEHPNIVRAFDLDHEGERHYLIMEFIQGNDLQMLVQQNGPLECTVAANLVAQAAEGLDYAHTRGLIHRDVKPGNLLLNERGVVKILDLGLALVSKDNMASLTLMHNENVIGTADYLAPEQAINSHDVDARADVYGLGCTLYFALSGQPPFPEGTIAQRILRHRQETPVNVEVRRPDCPAVLAEICMRMIRKRPEERFASCRQVADALEKWLEQSPGFENLAKLDVSEKVELLAMSARRLAPQPAIAAAINLHSTTDGQETDDRSQSGIAKMLNNGSDATAIALPRRNEKDRPAIPQPPNQNTDERPGSAILEPPAPPAVPPMIERLIRGASPTSDVADQTVILSNLSPRIRPQPGTRQRPNSHARRRWAAVALMTLLCVATVCTAWFLLGH